MIPIYEPFLGTEELALVTDAVNSSWISSQGVFIEEFSKMLGEYISPEGQVSLCSNGTVALHLALIAAGVGSGDKVIVPDFTYVASINAILYVGATPMVVDVDEKTWVMDIQNISDAFLSQAKAIILVDVYGYPSLSKADSIYLKKYDLTIIQDCAESLGSFLDKKHTGSYADFATFSFFGNKTITTGEGGAVWSRDIDRAEFIDKIKSQGIKRGTRYEHDVLGYNYRMTNIQAAIGCAQLGKINEILARKRQLQDLYRATLEKHGAMFQQLPKSSLSSYWMISALFPSTDVNDFSDYLKHRNIDTRPFFSPVSRFKHLEYFNFDVFPNAKFLASNGLIFPSAPSLIDTGVVETVLSAVDEYFTS